MGGRGAKSGAGVKSYKKTVYTTISYQDKTTGKTEEKTYEKEITIYSTLPKGWKRGEGGDVPGYVYVTNGKGFFSGKQTGYIVDTLAKRLGFSVHPGASWVNPREQAERNKKQPKK